MIGRDAGQFRLFWPDEPELYRIGLVRGSIRSLLPEAAAAARLRSTIGSPAAAVIVPSTHAGRLDTMLDTVFVLLVIAGLLVVVGISQLLAIRLRLPPSVLLAAVGVGI